MIDRERLYQNAAYVLENHPDTVAADLARVVLAALAEPSVFLPEGFAIVKKPELLGLGVPAT